MPRSLKDNKKDAFIGLEQVSMFIIAYEAKSHVLSR